MTEQANVRYRRSWPQRMVLLACAGLAGTSLYTASTVQTVYDDVASIQRIAIPADVLTDRTNVEPSAPRNILLVGTTENDGIDANDDLLLGRANTLLSDTIMVLRVEPDTGQAYVMSINRDLWLPSFREKINAVVQRGGMGALVKAVKDYLEIPIDNFMVVNFSGFRKVVDQLDGVPVYFPYDARDKGSFFDATAGCHVLDGQQALNYVRSRYYEQKINGRWVQDPTSDYGRVERQRDFLVLALDRAVEKGARNPTVLKRLLNSATDSRAVTLDTELTVSELLNIGQSFAEFKPENLQRMTLPSNGGMVGDASVVLLDEAEAPAVLDIFRGYGSTLQPKQVSLQMIDARGKVEETTRPDTLLIGRGFKVINRMQQTTGATEARTIVRYSADQRNAAVLISRYLLATPIYQEVTGSRQLTVVLGQDFEGVPLLPKEEADLIGIFPGLGGVTATTAPATTTTTPRATGATSSTRPASGATATSSSTTSTTTSTTTTTIASATTTTSGIYGRPPEGVSCK